jgi:hypothetical protein
VVREAGGHQGAREGFELALGAGEDGDGLGAEAGAEPALEVRDGGGVLCLGISVALQGRDRAAEDAARALAGLGAVVHVVDLWIDEAIGGAADLLGGAVVDPEDSGAAANLEAEGAEGEAAAVDPLACVAAEEELAGIMGGEGGEQAELGDAEVLDLVDEHGVEGARGERICEHEGGALADRGPIELAFGEEAGAERLKELPHGLALAYGEGAAAAGALRRAVVGPVREALRVDDAAPFGEEELVIDAGRRLGELLEDGFDPLGGGRLEARRRATGEGERLSVHGGDGDPLALVVGAEEPEVALEVGAEGAAKCGE